MDILLSPLSAASLEYTEMTKHKHAEFFCAIAEGDDMSQWECHKKDWSHGWSEALSWAGSIAKMPNVFEVRRKPKTIRIGGMEVPEPMRVAPAYGARYWVADPTERIATTYLWANDSADNGFVSRGVAHATEDGARLHREALIKVSGGTP